MSTPEHVTAEEIAKVWRWLVPCICVVFWLWVVGLVQTMINKEKSAEIKALRTRIEVLEGRR